MWYKNIVSSEIKINDLIPVKEACNIALPILKEKVSPSHILDIVKKSNIRKYNINKTKYISLSDLKEVLLKKKKQLIEIENNSLKKLSFEYLKESETTKHIHNLHPYPGKFIPQLIEYFLDSHTDNIKKQIFFKKNDIILDPFCGSGTTLVQANELEIHAIGIELSTLGTLLSNCKIYDYNLTDLKDKIESITYNLINYQSKSNILNIEKELNETLKRFNQLYFPKKQKNITKEYIKEKENHFNLIFIDLLKKHKIKIQNHNTNTFIDQWLTYPIKKEILLIKNNIEKIENYTTKNLLKLILSRTVRSCRATTHKDLIILKKPVFSPYYCQKHNKICLPLLSSIKWWNYYCQDTIKRIEEFNKIKTKTKQLCIQGDSRNITIIEEIEKIDPSFAYLIKKQKIKGIFSSPPYIGIMDYQDQHQYFYELFNIEKNNSLEIGSANKKLNSLSKEKYIEDISLVLLNCKKYLSPDYNIFLVVHDKYNLYPTIAEKSGMKIVNSYQRLVPKRSRISKVPFSETILHIKENTK